MFIKQNREGVNIQAKVELTAVYTPSATLPIGRVNKVEFPTGRADWQSFLWVEPTGRVSYG